MKKIEANKGLIAGADFTAVLVGNIYRRIVQVAMIMKKLPGAR